jgi:predicted Rossmann fold flavoprotein
MPLKKIAIIGGGAAGMIAAAILSESSTKFDIYLYEKNEALGKKVMNSGGGRCNITTGISSFTHLFSKYTRGSHFLKHAIGFFPPKKVMEWFIDHSLPLKTEKDERVFPLSDNGKDVIKTFQSIFNKNNVHISYNTEVTHITKKGEIFMLQANTQELSFDSIIITTGGDMNKSKYSGYVLAELLGHTITPLAPSLTSFKILESQFYKLKGLTLSSVEIQFSYLKKKYSVNGDMIFTHFGISGPLIFALSSKLAFQEISPENPITIKLILLKDTLTDTCFTQLQTLFMQSPKKQIDNILGSLFPSRFIETLLLLQNINPQKRANEISKKEIRKLADTFTNGFELILVNRMPGDEFVTAGGVSLLEVDGGTMESKVHKNLYFAGEVLDIDGLTGGFNLQAAWATGSVAAQSIINNEA